MNQLNRLRRKMDKIRRELRKASSRTKKYRVLEPITTKRPHGQNIHQLEQEYGAKNKLVREYRKLREQFLELKRRSKKKS